MACKRSAVRSRLPPPTAQKQVVNKSKSPRAAFFVSAIPLGGVWLAVSVLAWHARGQGWLPLTSTNSAEVIDNQSRLERLFLFAPSDFFARGNMAKLLARLHGLQEVSA